MNAEHLVYWIRGFMERAGIEGWGDACTAAVVRHAEVVLGAHPGDTVALTAKALARHPAALSDWLDTLVVRVTNAISADYTPSGVEAADFDAVLRKAMEDAKAHRLATGGPPHGWPVLYC